MATETRNLPTSKTDGAGTLMEQVMLQGDLSKLSPKDRVLFYSRTCDSLGLNPLTKPFDFIVLNGRLTLYARKDCADQLRSLRNVSVTITARENMGGVYVVTAKATMPDGRTDESIGAVPIEGLKGDALANCFMKAETKAKRRVTLSICGLGITDETEVDTIPGARPVQVDTETGEIAEQLSQSVTKEARNRQTDLEEWQERVKDLRRHCFEHVNTNGEDIHINGDPHWQNWLGLYVSTTNNPVEKLADCNLIQLKWAVGQLQRRLGGEQEDCLEPKDDAEQADAGGEG